MKHTNSEKAILGKRCYNCDAVFVEGDEWFYWYHADQDDRVCAACAIHLKHTDTAYAGLPVARVVGRREYENG